MGENTVLQIPLFKPRYDKILTYGYKGKNGDNLLKLLYDTSQGYCMYCYSKVNVDSKKFGQLEHSIEKAHCKEILEECVPNIALACPKCNMSFKRKGENDFTITESQISNLVNNKCIHNICKSECAEYRKLKRNYVKQRNIILQPAGICVGNRIYRIQYNLKNLNFEPSNLFEYTEKDLQFINSHITQFNLNDADIRTRELILFCEDYIRGNHYLRKGLYNNLIVDLFIDKLIELGKNEAIQLCEMVYTIARMKKVI